MENKSIILITGSNGLVGQALQMCLIDSGKFNVIATSLHENRFPRYAEIKFEQLDITNEAQINYLFELYKPDFIIHSAAISQIDYCEENKDEAWNINVNGTKYIAKSAKKLNAHLIYLSSDFVFNGFTGMYNEIDALDPVSFYGVTKVESEKLIQTELENWSIVRTVLVYGLNYHLSRNNILTWVIDSLKNNKGINVVNDQFRTPTLDMDLANGIVSIAENSAKGIFHLSGNEYLSVYDFALRIADFFELDRSLISPISSLSLNQIGKRPPKTGFDISKANRELNYFPKTIEEGLNYLKSL